MDILNNIKTCNHTGAGGTCPVVAAVSEKLGSGSKYKQEKLFLWGQ
jgi:hypothetical protein